VYVCIIYPIEHFWSTEEAGNEHAMFRSNIVDSKEREEREEREEGEDQIQQSVNP